MDAPTSQLPGTPLTKAGRAFLNFSLALVMIVLASLIGVGGAAFFIYKQMGNSLNVSKASAGKTHGATGNFDNAPSPELTPLPTANAEASKAVAASVSDASEWHFAEFSDEPRYIDVTYDNGRQHARLKVNTVLSSKPETANVASSSVSDVDPGDDESDRPALTDPGSRYIRDKQTGRVIGIDGTVGAAMEVRRAQPVAASPPAASTIRNPVPEVRVASPVMQFGRPVFDGDRPVQSAIPVTAYPPTRKALPVDQSPDEARSGFDVQRELTEDNLPVRRAVPARRGANALPDDSRFPTSDRTYLFGRN